MPVSGDEEEIKNSSVVRLWKEAIKDRNSTLRHWSATSRVNQGYPPVECSRDLEQLTSSSPMRSQGIF